MERKQSEEKVIPGLRRVHGQGETRWIGIIKEGFVGMSFFPSTQLDVLLKK